MKEERNVLQEKVFPKLEKFCLEKDARFQAIDLRWGVREEAGLDQKTMEICLAEIARCQKTGIKPNFIVLLGDRYGWRPLPARIEKDEFEAVLTHVNVEQRNLLVFEEGSSIANNGWYRLDWNAVPPEYVLLPRAGKYKERSHWDQAEADIRKVLTNAAHVAGLAEEKFVKYEASATHQEILAGLGENPEDREHVFAFFRKPQGQEDPDLTKLKDSLTRTDSEFKLPVGNVHEFGALDILCKDVEESLRKVIEAEVSKFQSRTPMTQEVDAHAAFAKERSKLFVGREVERKAIQDYLAGNDQRPLVVRGLSGSGKSALMAVASNGKNAVRRFIGATPESSSGITLLRSLCQELGERFGQSGDVPTTFNQLMVMFQHQLRLATPEQPLILLVDALDQLGTQDPAAGMHWLPAELPPYCRVVLSTTEVAGALKGAATVEVESLPVEYAELALDAWLAEAGRMLQPEQREKLLASFGESGLPLYLKLAFEEARLWRSFDPLEKCILGDGVPGIIDQLLARLSDPANHGQLLVSHALDYLTAARYGLTEDEILHILAADDAVWNDFQRTKKHDLPQTMATEGGEDKRRLPVIVWSRLYLDLEPYLTERAVPGGRTISFYHRQLVESVDSSARIHLQLADYFRNQEPMNSRKCSEWPWQLRAANAWEPLKAALTSVDLFNALYNDEYKWELAGYWVSLRERGYDLEKSYADAIQAFTGTGQPFLHPELLYRLGMFLIENGGRKFGSELMDRAAEGSGDSDYATAQGALALLLEERGDFDTALAIRKQVLETHELQFGVRHRFTATACLNLAGTYAQMGLLPQAEALARRALATDEELCGHDHVEVAKDLITLAECLRANGALEGAEATLQRALRIARGGLPSQDPLVATILSNLAAILTLSGRMADAEALAREAVEIERAVLGKENPKLAVRLNNLAALMKSNGRMVDALGPAQEALNILVAHSVRAGFMHRDLLTGGRFSCFAGYRHWSTARNGSGLRQ